MVRRRNLFAACAAIIVFGFAMGLTYPLLSLLLERRGVPETVIGMNAAMSPLGILVFSIFIPVLARRFGARTVTIVAALSAALILLGYKVFPSLEAWFALRLLHGIGRLDAVRIVGELGGEICRPGLARQGGGNLWRGAGCQFRCRAVAHLADRH